MTCSEIVEIFAHSHVIRARGDDGVHAQGEHSDEAEAIAPKDLQTIQAPSEGA